MVKWNFEKYHNLIDFGQIEIKITMYKWCQQKHYLQKNFKNGERNLKKTKKIIE